MTNINQLLRTLDGLLQPGEFADYCPNGLQVAGPTDVRTLVTGVSAHQELFTRAAERGADLVLVHHGLFWNGAPRSLDAVAVRRLRVLLDHDIALAAYHLPLDGHQVHGNNALLAAALGAESWVPFARPKPTHPPLGVAATFPGDGITRAELVDRVRTATEGREPLAFLDGPDPVRTVGIVSGSAADHIHDALALGLDAFITGEPAERVMAVARDYGITFLAAGHHATERFGVRRIGELLAAQHGLEHEFIDVPNPI